jgi:gliding motility-associated-like protein
MVNVDLLPVITSLMTDADSCANGTGTIHITADVTPTDPGAYTYQWNGPSNFNSQDVQLEFQNVTSAINGIYSLSVKNGACVSDTALIDIQLNDTPAQPIITGDQVYCNGDSIILGIQSPIPGGIYTWTTPDTTVSITSPGILILPNAGISFTGIYKVIVTVDGCTSLQALIGIQVRNELSVPVIISPSLVCEGDSLVLMSSISGSTIHWSGPNGFESDDVRPVIFPVTPATAGFYTVSYTLNGCQSPVSVPMEIKVQPSLATPGINADVTRICIDDPSAVHLCLTPGSGTSGGIYTWILNGSQVVGTPDTNSCITINGSPFQGGLNSVTVVASLQGCPSDSSNVVTVLADEIPNQEANAGQDVELCPDEIIVLNATNPEPSSGVWTSSSGNVIFSDNSNPNSLVNSLPPGEYVMTWTLSFATCLDYSADSVNVGIIFSPQVFPDTVDVPFGQTVEFVVTANDSISMGPFTLQIVNGTHKGNALHAGNGIFRYTPNIGFVGTDFLIYRICSTDCPDECSETTVVLRVGNEDDCFVPTLFTPNDDGVNDVLIIPCLETERFPQNKIIVFNEWGAVVYTASPYQNDWDGSVTGDPLPVGTYFYIMDFGDGSTPKRTFLVLER